jgi:hypothetical protein
VTTTAPTKKQKATAARALMRAIHAVEAAQNMACVRACGVDQSSINSAKDKIYYCVQKLEE